MRLLHIDAEEHLISRRMDFHTEVEAEESDQSPNVVLISGRMMKISIIFEQERVLWRHSCLLGNLSVAYHGAVLL